MHKVKPKQKVRIVSISIAVPADVAKGKVADEISALLSENGAANPDSIVLDWMYLTDIERSAIAPEGDVQEGEIFFRGMTDNHDEIESACRSAAQMLDGSQPKDIPGALAVLRYAQALRDAQRS